MNVSHPHGKKKPRVIQLKFTEAIDTCGNVINAREDRLSVACTWLERLEAMAILIAGSTLGSSMLMHGAARRARSRPVDGSLVTDCS